MTPPDQGGLPGAIDRQQQAEGKPEATDEAQQVDHADEVGELIEDVEAAFLEFSEAFGALSSKLNAVADETEQAECEAKDAFETAMKAAKARYEARLAELHADILDLRPISRETATTPPTKRAAYSDRTSLLMAKLSMLAYERFEVSKHHEDILRRKLEVGGLDLLGTFSTAGTQGYVCKNDKLAALVFRGTTDFVDWRTNLSAQRVVIKSHPKNVRAHEGFLAAYLQVEPQIVELLNHVPSVPLYLTGHSLGGALAVVASAALPMEDEVITDQLAAVYTFGSPRVGGGDFREIVKVPHYRVFNPWDIVPSVPPTWASFQHTGDIRFLARNDRAPLQRKSLLGGLLSMGVLRSLVLRITGSSRTAVKQHDIKKYVVKLDAIMRARRDWHHT